MKKEEECQLLRIFLDEGERCEGKPLYQAIVRKAKEVGLAGATVLRGMVGYGSQGEIHTTRILRLSEALPVVVEIVDQPERIESFLPHLDQMMTKGLVTLEKVQVISYRR